MGYFLVKRKWFLSGCLLNKMFMNSHKTDPNSCDFFSSGYHFLILNSFEPCMPITVGEMLKLFKTF